MTQCSTASHGTPVRGCCEVGFGVLDEAKPVLELRDPELELLEVVARDEAELAKSPARPAPARSLDPHGVAAPAARSLLDQLARLVAAHPAALGELVGERVGAVGGQRDRAERRRARSARAGRATRAVSLPRPCGLARRRCRRRSRFACAADGRLGARSTARAARAASGRPRPRARAPVAPRPARAARHAPPSPAPPSLEPGSSCRRRAYSGSRSFQHRRAAAPR